MSQTGKGVLDTVGDWASKNKTLLTALLAAGGTTALLGGLMSSDKEDESTSDSIKRKGTNALLAGAGGALATGGLMYGLKSFGDVGSSEKATPIAESTVDPIKGVLNTAAATGIGAGLGAGGTAATIGGINFLRRGADSKADDILRTLRTSLQQATINDANGNPIVITGANGKPIFTLNDADVAKVDNFSKGTLDKLLKDTKGVRGVDGLKQVERAIGMPALKDFAEKKKLTLKGIPKLPIKNLKGKAGLAALIGGAALGLPTAIYSYVNR